MQLFIELHFFCTNPFIINGFKQRLSVVEDNFAAQIIDTFFNNESRNKEESKQKESEALNCIKRLPPL